jgi:hypothetical protein
MQASTTLVLWVHNEVEVPGHYLRPHMQIANILQLLEEGTFIHIPLWPYTPMNHQLWSVSMEIRAVIAFVERCGCETDTSTDCQASKIPP